MEILRRIDIEINKFLKSSGKLPTALILGKIEAEEFLNVVISQQKKKPMNTKSLKEAMRKAASDGRLKIDSDDKGSKISVAFSERDNDLTLS